MKRLLLGFALLLGACSQEYIDQKNAERDHAFCHSVWGNVQQGYANCRMQKAHERHQAGTAAAIMSIGAGTQMLQNNRPTYTPAPPPITCRTYGNMTTCM